MEKRMLACFFIMCFFCLSIPKVVFGQSPAEQVFNDDKYKELFKRPEIIKELPDALRLFIEVGMNRPFRNNILANPRSLLGIDDDFDDDFTDEFILLLTVDEDLRSLFWDGQFYEVLTDPDEINKLIKLIESIVLPPAKLIIIGGNNQQGNPNTDLGEPLKIEVQDANENSLANIKVIFTVIKGSATLSTKEVTTNANGEAETTLTLESNEGITQVEAKVVGTDLTQTFTAAAVLADRPTVYITLPAEKTNYTLNDTFILNLNIVSAENASKFKATMQFDPTVFEYVESNVVNTLYSFSCKVNMPVNSDLEPYAEEPYAEVVIEGEKTDNTTVLAQLTFKVIGIKSSELTLSEVKLYDDANQELLAPYVLNRYVVFRLEDISDNIREDVNDDGIVSILDLVAVTRRFGEKDLAEDVNEDVNGDGEVSILDLVAVTRRFGKKNEVNECPTLICVY